MRGAHTATQFPSSLSQAACHLPGPLLGREEGSLQTLKAFETLHTRAGLCPGLVWMLPFKVIAGTMNASELHMTNQDVCSQPETNSWQSPELFHNLPFFQDPELMGTDSRYHGSALIQ